VSDAEHQPWRAAIRNARGVVVGAGFLVDDQHVVTCAQALRIPATGARPDGSVLVDFPAAGMAEPGSAAVRPDGWIPIGADDRGDVAVLQLQGDPPAGVEPAPLRQPSSLTEHRISTLAIRTGSSMASGPMGRCRGRVVRSASGCSWTQPQ
jgi:hypothetical protein